MTEPADRPYAGRVVLLTGAAGGFGACAARRFAAEGARLVLSDLSGERVAALGEALRAAGSEVIAEAVDVTEEASVAGHLARALAAFGRIDVAINNAGIGQRLAPLKAIGADEFDRIMAVNARGVFLGMKHQLPPMLQAGEGAILNVASAAGLVGAGHLAVYAAAKHAVVGLTRSVADEVARKGVRVNALCPSFAITPLFDGMADEIADRHGIAREDAYGRIVSRVPMGRVAAAEEIAEAMVWIASPRNGFMTGQAIALDGGLTAI